MRYEVRVAGDLVRLTQELDDGSPGAQFEWTLAGRGFEGLNYGQKARGTFSPDGSSLTIEWASLTEGSTQVFVRE